LKQLRGFLSLTGYYRRFIKGYASIAAPLTELLKKDVFLWDKTTEEPFQKLKRAITEEPVLALPNFEVPFDIETHSIGIGAVLSQGKHPIAYFSKKISPIIYHNKSNCKILALSLGQEIYNKNRPTKFKSITEKELNHPRTTKMVA